MSTMEDGTRCGKFSSTSDGKYLIKNRWSGLYLCIQGDSEDNSALCVQRDNDGSEKFKWYFLVTE